MFSRCTASWCLQGTPRFLGNWHEQLLSEHMRPRCAQLENKRVMEPSPCSMAVSVPLVRTSESFVGSDATVMEATQLCVTVKTCSYTGRAAASSPVGSTGTTVYATAWDAWLWSISAAKGEMPLANSTAIGFRCERQANRTAWRMTSVCFLVVCISRVELMLPTSCFKRR